MSLQAQRAPEREDASVWAVVQARMSSQRLPGKVVADVGGLTALELLVHRLRGARELDGILVATSVEAADDAIEAECRRIGVPVFRGPLVDVLERYRLAAVELACDGVARITGDCPLIDAGGVDAVVQAWRESGVDYASNALDPRGYPDGTDCEVLGRELLTIAAQETEDVSDREHATRFIMLRPDRFSHRAVGLDPPAADVRYSLDTAEDLELIRGLVERLGPDAALTEIVDELRGGADTAQSRPTSE